MAEVGLLEDNIRIAKLCATMLQYAGHRVIIYKHPYECLDALLPPSTSTPRDLDKLPSSFPSTLPPLPVDVLILDLHLPDIDGVEVMRRLSSHPHTQSLPLIFCTAATHTEIARALHAVPHAAFVEKPFKMQSLTSAVAKALGEPLR
jgi:CheY-like chemotaxis protein